MSLDVAQILAPATAGQFPGAVTTPAGEGVAAGDFAAVLESLAGGQAAPASAPASGSAASVPGGPVPDGSLPPAGDPPVLAMKVAMPTPRRTDMATPVGEGAREDAEPAAPAIDLRPVDGLLVAVTPLVPQAWILAKPDREAAPEAGTDSPGALIPSRPAATPDPAPLVGGSDLTLAAAAVTSPTPPAEQQLASGPAPDLATNGSSPTPQAQETQARAAAPAAQAFALAAGLVRVTGQIVPAATGSARAEDPLAPEEAPEAIAAVSATGLEADPFQVPDPVRQGLLPQAAPELRPQEPSRGPTAAGSGSPVLARAETDGEDAAPATLAAAQPAPGAAARQIDPASGQGRTPQAGETPATDEAGDVPARLAGGDPQSLLSAGAPTSVPAEAPEAPPAPVRANPETLAALSAQMARRLDDGTTRFTLELNPGDLGRVDVRMEIDAAGGIRAAFTFEHAHSASELSRRSDELQKSLESAGFNLSGGLSFDVAGDRSQGRSQAWAEARDERSRTPAAPEPERAREGPAHIADALSGRRTSARSGVDIRI